MGYVKNPKYRVRVHQGYINFLCTYFYNFESREGVAKIMRGRGVAVDEKIDKERLVIPAFVFLRSSSRSELWSRVYDLITLNSCILRPTL